MTNPIAYEDAVDLLDADHKAVKKMFIDYSALCDDGAPADLKRALGTKICQALTVHAQIEEELFYPEVQQAIGDDALMNHALEEHAEAKKFIARLQSMKTVNAAYDEGVKELGKVVDEHVLEERGQIFLQARRAAIDLRGLVVPMLKRQRMLKKKAASTPTKELA